ncbi:hypothetical protein AB4281_09935 [Vibrio splendidus]
MELKFIFVTLKELSEEFSPEKFKEWKSTFNGPYNDKESPLRTASHIMKVNSYLFTRTKDEKYFNRIYELYNLIVEMTHDLSTFEFRKKEGKDSSNGLIGPAWLMEGLISALKATNDTKFKECAIKVYQSCAFDKENLTWTFMNDHGKYVIDPTFNHQLWFATQAMKLGLDEGRAFIQHFIPKIKIDNGIIFHLTPLVTGWSSEGFRQKIRYYKYKHSLREKSLSYNAFNLHALCACYISSPDSKVWKENNFHSLRSLEFSKEVFETLLKSKYGFTYNPQAPAYLLFGKLFDTNIYDSYKASHELVFSGFTTHESNQDDILLKIRNYEYIDLLELIDD